MKTLLPFPSFAHSVAVMDATMLRWQRVECRQILTALRGLRAGRSIPWSGEPGVQMWLGYDSALAVLDTLLCDEWEARGGYEMPRSYDSSWRRELGADPALADSGMDAVAPPWLGDERLHASHRSEMLRQNPEHFALLGWEEPEVELWWPTREH